MNAILVNITVSLDIYWQALSGHYLREKEKERNESQVKLSWVKSFRNFRHLPYNMQ